MSVVSSLLRRLTVGSVLTLGMIIPSSATPAKPASVAPEQPMAHYIEVRLRKLHLVRPDLIPYPIAFEVYC
jgi:hypothetical protein